MCPHTQHCWGPDVPKTQQCLNPDVPRLNNDSGEGDFFVGFNSFVRACCRTENEILIGAEGESSSLNIKTDFLILDM